MRVAADRGLQQVWQPSGEGAGAAEGAGALWAATPDADYLGGLAPSLANLTSCVWSLQLDRAAVVRAVRARLQQGGAGGGNGDGNSSSSGSCSSGGGVQSPVDVSYVLLQSVQLVVPERELLLLAWAWATNATRHAAHPGLAEQLQLMLDGSRLAGGAEAALQQLLHGPTDSHSRSPPALPAGLRLVFDQFVWCGLLGTNVTLTSQLPGPTPLSLQLPDLDLPVAYDMGFDVQPQGGDTAPQSLPPWVGVSPAAVPQPSPGLVGGRRTPEAAAGGSDGRHGAAEGAPARGAGTAGSVAPGRGNEAAQQPAAAAAAAGGRGGRGVGGGGDHGGGSSAPAVPLGAVVALAVGCGALVLGLAAGVEILQVRRRRDRAGAKEEGCELDAGGEEAPGVQGSETKERCGGEGVKERCGGEEGNECCGGHTDTHLTSLEGSCASALTHSNVSGSVHKEQSSADRLPTGRTLLQQQQQEPHAPGQPRLAPAPRPPSFVLRQLASIRLGVETQRRLVSGQQQPPPPPQRRPAELPTGTHRLSCESGSIGAGAWSGFWARAEQCL